MKCQVSKLDGSQTGLEPGVVRSIILANDDVGIMGAKTRPSLHGHNVSSANRVPSQPLQRGKVARAQIDHCDWLEFDLRICDWLESILRICDWPKL